MDDIWEVAKKIELEGKNFYLSLGKEAQPDELAGIFHYLAGQEDDHFDIFLSMQDGRKPSKTEATKASRIAKEAFTKIAVDFNDSKPVTVAEDALNKAVSMEEETIEYYLSLLEKETSDENRAAINVIIEEEEDHKAVLESIIEFSNGPKEFLDKTEF